MAGRVTCVSRCVCCDETDTRAEKRATPSVRSGEEEPATAAAAAAATGEANMLFGGRLETVRGLLLAVLVATQYIRLGHCFVSACLNPRLGLASNLAS